MRELEWVTQIPVYDAQARKNGVGDRDQVLLVIVHASNTIRNLGRSTTPPPAVFEYPILTSNMATIRLERRLTTHPAAPKLRDSCNTCAASKVRCGKEKPICARCSKRGLSCEYFVTKRAGRSSHGPASSAGIRSPTSQSSTGGLTKAGTPLLSRDTRPSETTDVMQTLSGPGSSSSSDTGAWISPTLTQSSPGQRMPDDLDALLNLPTPVDPASTSSALRTLNTDLDGSFASVTTGDPGPETLAQSYIDFSNDFDGLLDLDAVATLFTPDNMFSISGEAVSDLLDLSNVHSPSNNQVCSPSDALDLQRSSSQSPCCCLLDTLGYLKQLFPTASTVCTRSKSQDFEDATCQLPTIQSVVAENQQIVEAISEMLQCPCSQDGYVLTIMALVVFKALDWYIAAARDVLVDGQNLTESQPDHRPPSSCYTEHVLICSAVVGDYCIDGEDRGRMAAQLVLGKLHRVQHLVSQLSQRLRGHGMSNGTEVISSDVAQGQNKSANGRGGGTLPFSQNRLDQLESDLRERLSTVSLEIVDMLRRA